MSEYWNHNTAYHPWIIRAVEERGHRDVLDVGCGDGLLLQRLAPRVGTVTGLEPDAPTRARAGARLATTPNATLDARGFDDFAAEAGSFDAIAFVATLHHMPLRASLGKARDLLRPGGDLLVVGLSRDRTLGDLAFAAITLPAARLGSFAHGEAKHVGVPVALPRESLTEIRATSDEVLPGSRIRRGLYFRYLLRWTKPAAMSRS